jgi:YD repeat-containing protein
MLHRAILAGLLGLSLVSAAGLVIAQSAAIEYAYDELGRLVAVVDQQGDAALYEHDATGNLLSIRRVDAASLPGPVAIVAMVPDRGRAGTTVSLLGKGFDPGGRNTVAFTGVAAAVTYVSPYRLVTAVPSGATSGPLTVTTPVGSAASPGPFRVIEAFAVMPSTASLGPGAAQPFAVSAAGTESVSVLWAIDGIVGGDLLAGTISAHGVYVAPATVAATRTVQVSAISRDDPAVVATALVTLHAPTPRFLAAAPVGVALADSGTRTWTAPAVAVQRAPGAGGLTVIGPAVGIAPFTLPAFVTVTQVSVSREPLVASVSPTAAARGAAPFTLSLSGFGLAGATAVELRLDHADDPAISLASLTVAPDGRQLSVAVSITAGAVPGPRVVRVRTPAGTSTSIGTAGNVFTVQ